MPTISVIVPTYNGAEHLYETLDSLAGQEEPPHEIIVVDDGSMDDSAGIAETHPSRPHVLRQPNRGVAYARNAGTAAASGEYVAFLDQDDLWAKRRHARLQRFLASHPECDAVVTTCTGFYRADDEHRLRNIGDLLHRSNIRLAPGASPLDIDLPREHSAEPQIIRVLDRHELLAGPPSVTASYILRRDLLLAAGGCVPFARSYDDYLGLLNLSLATQIVLIDEPTLLYRIHPGSTTMSTNWQLPLLTGIAAVRHGGNVVPSGHGRDPMLAPSLLDDRRFFVHFLLDLANGSFSGLLDSLALIRLLATSGPERRQLSVLAMRRWLAGLYPKPRTRR
jgi:glycosyltransferase involved in cell wall biosynthesis